MGGGTEEEAAVRRGYQGDRRDQGDQGDFHGMHCASITDFCIRNIHLCPVCPLGPLGPFRYTHPQDAPRLSPSWFCAPSLAFGAVGGGESERARGGACGHRCWRVGGGEVHVGESAGISAGAGGSLHLQCNHLSLLYHRWYFCNGWHLLPCCCRHLRPSRNLQRHIRRLPRGLQKIQRHRVPSRRSGQWCFHV